MKKISVIVPVICFMALILNFPVRGAEVASVMNTYTDSDSVVLYMEDPGREIDQVYLGNSEAQRFETKETGSVRTVVLLDNSLSVGQKYRDLIRDFLTELVAARKDGDTFTIATFAQSVTYLVQNSNDYLEIKDQIDALEFADQDSYFINSLYTVLEDIQNGEEIKFTRVIVIADGAENEAFGYTEDELDEKMKAVNVPVYTIGCPAGDNEERIRKMFSLSRMSNAQNFLLGEVPVTDILKGIMSDADMVQLRIFPQDELCDGTEKSIRVCFGEDYCSTMAVMPFKVAAQAETETPAETEAGRVEILETETPETKAGGTEAAEEQPAEEAGPAKAVPAGIAGAAAVLAGLGTTAFTLIKQAKRKKKTEDEKKDFSKSPGKTEKTASQETAILGGPSGAASENSTEILVGKKAVRLILRDVKDSSRSFEYPLRDKVVIGKSPDRCQIVVDYDPYISGVHCEIVSKGNGFYVRDGSGEVISSRNGTFVNEEKAVPELPLPAGATLKIGQTSFKVTYK